VSDSEIWQVVGRLVRVFRGIARGGRYVRQAPIGDGVKTIPVDNLGNFCKCIHSAGRGKLDWARWIVVAGWSEGEHKSQRY